MHVTMRLLAALICLGLCIGPVTAAAPSCEIDRPVRLSGLDWDSDRFHVAVVTFILEHGFGCKSEVTTGTTIPLISGLVRGDLDVIMEIWKDNITEIWEKGEKAGKTVLLGVNYPDAVQGWFVPRYLVEGDKAPAKGLKHVNDLPAHKHLFSDPEEPERGRFYNCKLGWSCEIVNTKKLGAYGLEAHYTNFRPGTGSALAAAIASAYTRRKPILYYYWGPSWVLGKYDAVMLEEPPYDAAVWRIMAQNAKPKQAVAYPPVAVYIGANTGFVKAAPGLVRFFRAYRTTNALVSEALVYLQETKGASPRDAALHFLKTHGAVWTKWLPPEAAARVQAAL